MNRETAWQVEAWRGLAAWLVVYAHYWAGMDGSWAVMRFAFTGVDLFFVLSGFVFAPYFFGQRLRVGAFAIRRLFRIYPTYALALMVYFCLKAAQGSPLDFWWQHVVFAHVQSREMAFYYNAAFWSLPAEVEFYLALPLLAWFTRGRLGHVLVLLLAALALRAALGLASDPLTQNSAYIYMYHLPGMLVEFLLGALAWWLAKRDLSVWRRMLLFVCGMALWMYLALFFALGGDAAVNAGGARGQLSWLAAVGFALMVAASATAWPQVPEFLKTMAFWSGKISYGSYLFHTAALMLVQRYLPLSSEFNNTLAAACLTLLLAWLGYAAWENPWRQYGRAWAERQNTSVSPG